MDLNNLHSLMKRKKFHYFEGRTNEREGSIFFSFSKIVGGRGDGADIRIGDDGKNDIDLWIKDLTYNVQLKNISDNHLISFIEDKCK